MSRFELRRDARRSRGLAADLHRARDGVKRPVLRCSPGDSRSPRPADRVRPRPRSASGAHTQSFAVRRCAHSAKSRLEKIASMRAITAVRFS